MKTNDPQELRDPQVRAVCMALERMNDAQRKEVRNYANHLLGFHTNTVDERVPYKDGHLANEYRYTKKDTPQGPYWYFYWFDDGQRKLYIGKCDLEEAKRRVEEKRSRTWQ
jgi:hypothetical protein